MKTKSYDGTMLFYDSNTKRLLGKSHGAEYVDENGKTTIEDCIIPPIAWSKSMYLLWKRSRKKKVKQKK